MNRITNVAAGLLGLAFSAAVWATAPASAAGDAERGEKLYQLCDQCHGAVGEGSQLALAPSIAGLPEWYVLRQLQGFRAGHRGRHFDDISGMRMRPMARVLQTEEDVAAAAAYVAGLPIQRPEPTLEGGDAARGQALYAPCIACHGLDGSGMEALGSPPINHQNDWYMLTQLQHFKAGIRGTAPGDVQGALMRPMSMILADDQAMKDVIAFIMTLSKTQAAK